MNPFQVVKDFESALSDYTGAPYVVTVNSCTMALFLALRWERMHSPQELTTVVIPKYTYPSVPMVAIQAGWEVDFADSEWSHEYGITPTRVVDSARMFSSRMYRSNTFDCVSFHPQKCLALSTGGGAILHSDQDADQWFRRARFDGRHEGVITSRDTYDMMGYHCYMMPAAAAEGLQRLYVYRRVQLPVENNYPDLSKAPLFNRPTL